MRTPLRSLVLLSLLLAPALPVLARTGVVETFTGRVTGGPAGVGGVVSMTAHVTRYASDAEAQQLLALLAEGGREALLDALRPLDSGSLVLEGNPGQTIALARQLQDERGGRIVRLVVLRRIGYLEATNVAATAEYPLSYVELRVSPEGRGEGTYAAAADVQFDGGTLAIRNYASAPARVLGLRARAPK